MRWGTDMTRILKPLQVAAVYAAMCELNNIGGILETIFSDGRKSYRVKQHAFGHGVRVECWISGSARGEREELYTSQAAFREAYSL